LNYCLHLKVGFALPSLSGQREDVLTRCFLPAPHLLWAYPRLVKHLTGLGLHDSGLDGSQASRCQAIALRLAPAGRRAICRRPCPLGTMTSAPVAAPATVHPLEVTREGHFRIDDLGRGSHGEGQVTGMVGDVRPEPKAAEAICAPEGVPRFLGSGWSIAL
jgi:hypothetical protein